MGMTFELVKSYTSVMDDRWVDPDAMDKVRESCDAIDKMFSNWNFNEVFVDEADDGVSIGYSVNDMLVVSDPDSGFYDFIRNADKVRFKNEGDCKVVLVATFRCYKER